MFLPLRISHLVIVFLKKAFDKKTVLLVTKKQIRSYSIGSSLQVFAFFTVLWLGNLLIQSLKYDSVINKKALEISNLKESNQEFGSKVDSLNANLQKINTYFKSVSGYTDIKNKAEGEAEDKKIQDLFGGLSLNDQDQEVAAKIANSNLILEDIKSSTVKRIEDLEKKLSIAGIAFTGNKATLKKTSDYYSKKYSSAVSLNTKDELITKQGGPFIKDLTRNLDSGANIFNFRDNQFSIKNEIEYLANLEKFIHFAPLLAPMKNYYVSSVFGKRTDPFKRTSARHEGMDFAGKIGEKILSPSAGKVIFAGKFSSYGNAVIIDHGYGLTTRYGHLSKIYVNKGDPVVKKQVIGAQGTTGRSTGAHLHYEVRYKNIPLNPKKFLQAGQEIFNSNS